MSCRHTHTHRDGQTSAALTLSEVVQVRQQDVGRVAAGQTLDVVFGHLAELLPIDAVEEGHIHLGQPVLLHGPFQPLTHVIRRPQTGICRTKLLTLFIHLI